MSCSLSPSYQYDAAALAERPSAHKLIQNRKEPGCLTSPPLAASMTKEASTQTYFTIRYLADGPLAADAYRAYAYFRWVDDILDQDQIAEKERLAFLAKQQELIAHCYRGERPVGLCPEENLVVDLIHNDKTEASGLRIYIEQMMAVMAIDANRKGRLITQEELDEYTLCLATAVTEALHYFIGHDDATPRDQTRYAAVTGAHVTHMLRDAINDAAAGYYNIPKEYLEAHGIEPTDVHHEAYRSWVRDQVKLARDYFAIGRANLARVENLRCRLAGYAYIGRFEVVLDAIEKEEYRLRPAYPERKRTKVRLKMGLSALAQTILSSLPGKGQSVPSLTTSTEITA